MPDDAAPEGSADDRPHDPEAARDMASAHDPPRRGKGRRPAMNLPGPDAGRDEPWPARDGRAEPYAEEPETIDGAVGRTSGPDDERGD